MFKFSSLLPGGDSAKVYSYVLFWRKELSGQYLCPKISLVMTETTVQDRNSLCSLAQGWCRKESSHSLKCMKCRLKGRGKEGAQNK